MSLYQSPPEVLEIDGKTYPIDTDFRTWIRFQSIMVKDNTDEEKTADLLQFISELGLPFSEMPLQKTLAAIVDFYTAGDSRRTEERKKPTYNFETDSNFIFSAFLTQYGADLMQEKIHWWKFKAMFSSLSQDHMISKIMWARGADTKDMSEDMKKYVEDIRKHYPLSTNTVYTRKMTLEERNQKWLDYVAKRFEETKESDLS